MWPDKNLGALDLGGFPLIMGLFLCIFGLFGLFVTGTDSFQSGGLNPETFPLNTPMGEILCLPRLSYTTACRGVPICRLISLALWHLVDFL